MTTGPRMVYQRTLGIDPATRCGWSMIDENGEWLGHGAFQLGDGDKRLVKMEEFIRERIAEYQPSVIAVEGAAFGAFNRATAEFHGMLLGVIRLAAQVAHRPVPVWVYQPSKIKKYATGSGRAEKPQMVAAARLQFGVQITDDNEADAMFIAHMANNYVKTSDEVRSNRRAAKKSTKGKQVRIKWPTT